MTVAVQAGLKQARLRIHVCAVMTAHGEQSDRYMELGLQVLLPFSQDRLELPKSNKTVPSTEARAACCLTTNQISGSAAGTADVPKCRAGTDNKAKTQRWSGY